MFFKIDTVTNPPIDILQKLAKDTHKENKKYFEKLKKKTPKNLDYVMQDLHEAEFKKTDCLECANCCKTTGPLFTSADIERISKSLRQKPQQTLGSRPTRNNPDASLREGKAGAGRHHPQIAGSGKFKTTAKGVAIQNRNRRFAQACQTVENPVAIAHPMASKFSRAQISPGIDVGTGAKGAIARGCQHHGGNAAVVVDHLKMCG